MVAVALAARSRTASGLLDCDVHPAQMATRASDHSFFMKVRMPADERWIASGCVVLAIIIPPKRSLDGAPRMVIGIAWAIRPTVNRKGSGFATNYGAERFPQPSDFAWSISF